MTRQRQLNCTRTLRVNGIIVASKQFEDKDQKKLYRAADNWIADNEYRIRAVLTAASVQSAVILKEFTYCDSCHTDLWQSDWSSSENTYGRMNMTGRKGNDNDER